MKRHDKVRGEKTEDGRDWYVWTIELRVSETWVEDGWELHDHEQAKERVANMIPFAHNYEFDVKVVGKPKDRDVATAQGFKTVKAYKESNR